MMVLIVDDNKKYIERLIINLNENLISSIETANNYDEAIKQIAYCKPDIVLLDMNMTGKSGFEVLRYIKGEGWDCKVVMVTNHSNDSYRKLCVDAGADYFLDKSNEFEMIPSIIQKLSA